MPGDYLSSMPQAGDAPLIDAGSAAPVASAPKAAPKGGAQGGAQGGAPAAAPPRRS